MKLFILTSFFFILTSCSTIDSLQPGDGGRTFTLKGKSYSQIWKAANKVMSQQLTIVNSEKEKGTIRAEKGAGFATWGEVVGLFISPTTENSPSYQIEIQSKKRSSMQITGQDWEETILQGLKAELDI